MDKEGQSIAKKREDFEENKASDWTTEENLKFDSSIEKGTMVDSEVDRHSVQQEGSRRERKETAGKSPPHKRQWEAITKRLPIDPKRDLPKISEEDNRKCGSSSGRLSEANSKAQKASPRNKGKSKPVKGKNKTDQNRDLEKNYEENRKCGASSGKLPETNGEEKKSYHSQKKDRYGKRKQSAGRTTSSMTDEYLNKDLQSSNDSHCKSENKTCALELKENLQTDVKPDAKFQQSDSKREGRNASSSVRKNCNDTTSKTSLVSQGYISEKHINDVTTVKQEITKNNKIDKGLVDTHDQEIESNKETPSMSATDNEINKNGNLVSSSVRKDCNDTTSKISPVGQSYISEKHINDVTTVKQEITEDSKIDKGLVDTQDQKIEINEETPSMSATNNEINKNSNSTASSSIRIDDIISNASSDNESNACRNSVTDFAIGNEKIDESQKICCEKSRGIIRSVVGTLDQKIEVTSENENEEISSLIRRSEVEKGNSIMENGDKNLEKCLDSSKTVRKNLLEMIKGICETVADISKISETLAFCVIDMKGIINTSKGDNEDKFNGVKNCNGRKNIEEDVSSKENSETKDEVLEDRTISTIDSENKGEFIHHETPNENPLLNDAEKRQEVEDDAAGHNVRKNVEDEISNVNSETNEKVIEHKTIDSENNGEFTHHETQNENSLLNDAVGHNLRKDVEDVISNVNPETNEKVREDKTIDSESNDEFTHHETQNENSFLNDAVGHNLRKDVEDVISNVNPETNEKVREDKTIDSESNGEFTDHETQNENSLLNDAVGHNLRKDVEDVISNVNSETNEKVREDKTIDSENNGEFTHHETPNDNPHLNETEKRPEVEDDDVGDNIRQSIEEDVLSKENSETNKEVSEDKTSFRIFPENNGEPKYYETPNEIEQLNKTEKQQKVEDDGVVDNVKGNIEEDVLSKENSESNQGTAVGRTRFVIDSERSDDPKCYEIMSDEPVLRTAKLNEPAEIKNEQENFFAGAIEEKSKFDVPAENSENNQKVNNHPCKTSLTRRESGHKEQSVVTGTKRKIRLRQRDFLFEGDLEDFSVTEFHYQSCKADEKNKEAVHCYKLEFKKKPV